MAKRWLLLLVFLVLGVFIVSKLQFKTALLIDTDADSDDMMAICMLLKEPRIEVKAITTSGVGMATYEKAAPNIRNLLAFLGRSDIPVTSGAKISLSPISNFPASWRSDADNIQGFVLPKSDSTPVAISSSEMIVKQVKDAQAKGRKLDILAIGPMTNIAHALEDAPEIVSGIRKIVLMGGTIDVPGNVVGEDKGLAHPKSEYNIYLDALAASRVFESGIPIELVPLDATNSVPITDAIIARITKETTPTAGFIRFISAKFVLSQAPAKVYYWDPLAAAILTDPKIGKDKRLLRVKVNLNDKSANYGSLVTSAPKSLYTKDMKTDPNGAVMTVYLSADSAKFYEMFIQSVNRK